MNPVKKSRAEIVSLLPLDALVVSLEELEARLEHQIAALPMALDDAHCLYYLCTTRCSGTKCPVFCACDVVVDMGGTEDVL
jgi:hypothetical protein